MVPTAVYLTPLCLCPEQDALTEGQIVGITLGAVAVAGLLGYCCLQKQQRAMKNDIDGLIRQYQQLDGYVTALLLVQFFCKEQKNKLFFTFSPSLPVFVDLVIIVMKCRDGKGADLLQGKVRSDSAAATSDL
jgi:hypothetical protein